MNSVMIRRRAAKALAIAGAAMTLAACNDLLTVQNPGAIPEGKLGDPKLSSLMVGSIVGEFQREYDNLAYYGAILTDEAVTGHNFETIKEIDLRIARDNNGTVSADLYVPLQRARFAGDSLAGLIRAAKGDSAGTSIDLARANAYGGYSTMYLGEYFCKAPIDPSGQGASLDWDALMARASAQFDEAIAIATAAKAAGTKAAIADSILNLAHLGAARSALNVGDMPEAIANAQAVSPTFQFMVPHSTEKGFMENAFYGATNGTNQNLGVDAVFRNLNDRRVLHTPTARTGHNQLTLLYRPYQPESFGEWVATGDTVPFGRATPVRFASGLEARYILAEAEGATQRTVDLINERRKVGDPAATDITLAAGADAIMAELRTQKSRDFFMDGHRLGDLRRYKKLYGLDLFPQGPHPNASWGNYGTNECFLLPTSETTSNPNA